MGDATRTTGTKIELAGIGARRRYKLAQGRGRRDRIDDENVGTGCDQRHRDKVALDVIRHLGENWIYHRRTEVADDEAVAVGRLVGCVLHADRTRGASFVLDQDRLTPELGELLAQNSRHQV